MQAIFQNPYLLLLLLTVYILYGDSSKIEKQNLEHDGVTYSNHYKTQQMAEIQPMREYKIVIIGDAGVGKTTFITRHKTGEFVKKYEPTFGVVVRPVNFMTNYGEIQFNVWDPAGQEKFGGMYNDYYYQADGAIGMFSGDRRDTLRSLRKLTKELKNIAGEIPISVCGNKCDAPNHEHEYERISVKNSLNIDVPFLNLARKLTGHDDLVFEYEPM